MTELEKITYAKIFMDKLAKGINPLDDTPVPEGDILNHVRLSCCFSYVSDVLGQIVQNVQKREAKSQSENRDYFYVTEEQLQSFPYSEEPITLGEFCRRLETLADLSRVRRISRSHLPLWLVQLGLLCPPKPEQRHCAGGPSEEGLKIGIQQMTYSNTHGVHHVNVLSIDAQKFLIDNIKSFWEFREKRGWKI